MAIDTTLTGLPEDTFIDGTELIETLAKDGRKAIPLSALAGNLLPLYLGQVATRGVIPSQQDAAATTLNSQRTHIARDRITSLQIAYANWFATGTPGETASGGNMTVTAAIQYPIGSGVWQQFTWNSAGQVVVPNGTTSPLSDPLALTTPIPAGASFYIRSFQTNPSGVVYMNSDSPNIALYDFFEKGASLADKTQNGAAIPNQNNFNFGPVLLVGQTRRPSVLILGDSREKGNSILAPGFGDIGQTAMSVGQHFAYTNAGCAGELLNGFLTNGTRRTALQTYFSHVSLGFGINDVINGRTQAQMFVDAAAAVALFTANGKKVSWNTLYPRTTSTDGWATIANQTVAAEENPRNLFNHGLRAGAVAGLSNVFDVARVIESGGNGFGGKFVTGPGGAAITGDGLHINATGATMIEMSSVFSPQRFARA